jgi:DNA repair photolyase
MNAGSDFEKKIVVKINAPEVLRRQLAAKRWKGGGIAMGTATDTNVIAASGEGGG